MSTMKWNLNSHVWGWVYLWKYALKNSYISRHFGGLGIEKIRQNLGQTADSLSHLAFSSRLVFGAWCFRKPCWDLVGFRSLRLGFGGFSQLTAGFSDQHAGYSHLTAGFSDQHAGFYCLTAGFSQKKSFFRLGFLNKNQTNDFFLDFHKREGIVFIYLFLKNEDPAIPSWFLLIKPSRKKQFFFPKGSRKVVKPSMLIWKPSRKVEKPSMLIWKPSRKLRKPTKTQP